MIKDINRFALWIINESIKQFDDVDASGFSIYLDDTIHEWTIDQEFFHGYRDYRDFVHDADR